ncbi:hypothetical protein HDV05_004405 [Chytridiales sp. JEL 0842]|nr:hypothetical protein HDV05_004405 [Chytridiales sp. JEL 0842]
MDLSTAQRSANFESQGVKRILDFNAARYILKVWHWNSQFETHLKVRFFDTKTTDTVFEFEKSEGLLFARGFESRRNAYLSEAHQIESFVCISGDSDTWMLKLTAFPEPLELQCRRFISSSDSLQNELDVMQMRFNEVWQRHPVPFNLPKGMTPSQALAMFDGTGSSGDATGILGSSLQGAGKEANDGGYNIRRVPKKKGDNTYVLPPKQYTPPSTPPNRSSGPYMPPTSPPPSSSSPSATAGTGPGGRILPPPRSASHRVPRNMRSGQENADSADANGDAEDRGAVLADGDEDEFEDEAFGIRLLCRNTVIIGGPRSGKTTLLNNMMGSTRFHKSSGLLSIITHEGYKLIKSPSFKNEEDFEKNALQVADLINEGGDFQVIFVMQLDPESRMPRIGNMDARVMNQVLAKIKTRIHFGVIFNQVNPATIEEVRTTYMKKGGWNACGYQVLAEFPESAQTFGMHHLPSFLFLAKHPELSHPSKSLTFIIPGLPEFLRTFRTYVHPRTPDAIQLFDQEVASEMTSTWGLHIGRRLTPEGAVVAKRPVLNFLNHSNFVTMEYRNESSTYSEVSDTATQKAYIRDGWKQRALQIRNLGFLARHLDGEEDKDRTRKGDKYISVKCVINRAVLSIDPFKLELLPSVIKELETILALKTPVEKREYLTRFLRGFGDVLITQAVLGGSFTQTTVHENLKEDEIADRKLEAELILLATNGFSNDEKILDKMEKWNKSSQDSIIIKGGIAHPGINPSAIVFGMSPVGEGLFYWLPTVPPAEPDKWELVEILDSIPMIDVFREYRSDIELALSYVPKTIVNISRPMMMCRNPKCSNRLSSASQNFCSSACMSAFSAGGL